MSTRLAAALVLAGATLAVPTTAASAEPTCPPGWTTLRLTVPGTGINRFLGCLPPLEA